MSKNKEPKQNLLEKHPWIEKLWIYEKNGTTRPEDFTAGSNKKFWFKCENENCNEEKYVSIYDNIRSPKCKSCGIIKIVQNRVNDNIQNSNLQKNYPVLAELWSDKNIDNHGNKLYACDFSFKSKTKMWFKCIESGCNNEKYVPIKRILSSARCEECSYKYGGKNRTKNSVKKYNLEDNYPEIANLWDYDRNKNNGVQLYPKDFSYNSGSMMWFLCITCKKSRYVAISGEIASQNCIDCGHKEGTKNRINAYYESGNNFANKYPDYIIEWNKELNDLENLFPDKLAPHTNVKAWRTCSKCNHSWKQALSCWFNGQGCPKCTKNISKSEIEWLDYLNIPQELRQLKIIINNKKYIPDALDIENKKVYFYDGGHIHGDLRIFDKDAYAINHNTHEENFIETMTRNYWFEQEGYEVIQIWDNDWNKQKMLLNNVLPNNFINRKCKKEIYEVAIDKYGNIIQEEI